MSVQSYPLGILPTQGIRINNNMGLGCCFHFPGNFRKLMDGMCVGPWLSLQFQAAKEEIKERRFYWDGRGVVWLGLNGFLVF